MYMYVYTDQIYNASNNFWNSWASSLFDVVHLILNIYMLIYISCNNLTSLYIIYVINICKYIKNLN